VIRLFLDVLLPVFLVAAAGWTLSVRLSVDPRPLNRVLLHVLVPCLVFRILVGSRLDATALTRTAAFAVLALAVPALLAWAMARTLRWSRSRTDALALVVLLPNAGNLGLPITAFAFGDDALAHAGVFFVTSSVITYTAGVFLASVGRVRWTAALARLPRIPAIWSVVAAGTMLGLEASLPAPAMRAVDLLADAAIPTFLVVLGMQIRAGVDRGALPSIGLAASLRLVAGPVSGMVFAAALGLDGAARQACVLEAAMPSAVASVVLALEFDLEPRWVTSVVVATTLATPLTVTPLLAWLGA
jgi:predicted permease